MKTRSIFFPQELKDILYENLSKDFIARQFVKQAVDEAAYWAVLSDEELWQLIFSPTIHRAWMVWSDGYCPACNKDVRMYGWKIDAISNPWKVTCPHCQENFPKNDFHLFYRSGLDQRGIFHSKLADSNLLYNANYPDPTHPLYHFGVDDGDGYVEKENRWRFIGAYLIYGQWKQLIVNGIKKLSAAYVMTKDKLYAHKAAIMLDRVADVYPDFDFAKQGSAYEKPHGSGYVSTWHDACEETRELAMAYDMIYDALPEDRALVRFLSEKSKQTGMDNPKTSFTNIQRNIEKGILEDPLIHPERIHNNYPRTEAAIILIKTILDREEYRDEIEEMTDDIIEKATSVDGVTGEKGLAAYASYVIHGLAGLLAQFDRMDKNFLERMIQKHPGLLRTYRFHIDTLCLNRYYPRIGDTGSFGQPDRHYGGVPLHPAVTLSPSMHLFLFKLYEITKDPAYVQILYMENGYKTEGLPYDLIFPRPENIQEKIAQIIKEHGPTPLLKSINLKNWHLLLLRSGIGERERVLWMDYDSGGKHAHADGLNIGLFAYGMDLLPDFGYPPVQYGGWYSPKANWYKSSAAHNTVVVDGENHKTGLEPIEGKNLFWSIGQTARAVCVDGAPMTDCKRFERTLIMIDVTDHQSYIVDLFRVLGGYEHIKYTGSTFGHLTYSGLNLKPVPDSKDDRQMKNFTEDTPRSGWFADWTIEDRLCVGDNPNRDIHLRYRDFTEDATVQSAQAWVVISGTGVGVSEEAWIPRLCVKRKSNTGELASEFLSIMEPYENKPFIASAQKVSALKLQPSKTSDNCTVLQIRFNDETFEDLIVVGDVKEDQTIHIPSWGVTVNSACCVLRRQGKKTENLLEV